MNTFWTVVCAFLCATAFAGARASAQVPPELTVLQRQFERLLAERVTSIHAAGIKDLNASYKAILDRKIAEAKSGGDLAKVIAFEEEKKRLKDFRDIPADTAETSGSLKEIRGIYRAQMTKIADQRAAGEKVLLDPYLARLKELETTLTKADRINDARTVMEYRQTLSQGVPENMMKGALTPDGVFANGLGMKFVAVPGTNILICIHETRRSDYAAYSQGSPGVHGSWRAMSKDGVKAGHEDNHPVVGVSWADANGFCEWLGKKEGKTYRLPTDREWSMAAGIGSQEEKGMSPEKLSGKVDDVWPWGRAWPPRKGAGNYSDDTMAKQFPNRGRIEGYDDGHATTAPVMSYEPNKLGIHDLGGNVWEWCNDWYNDSRIDRVTRGGSWQNHEKHRLLSSERDHTPPDRRDPAFGFRCVLEVPPR